VFIFIEKRTGISPMILSTLRETHPHDETAMVLLRNHLMTLMAVLSEAMRPVKPGDDFVERPK